LADVIIRLQLFSKMPARTAKNEKQRLEVLWHYDVLDTVPEEVFDEMTDLAATICEAPIALISLVDEDRQWFKAKKGMSVSETARDISFCAHTILGDELFIVSDATKDNRFKNNPLVTKNPKIRFYAGAPLVTPNGHALGSLCVMDKEPRKLRTDQQKALRVLARHVVTQLELRRQARELTEVHASRAQIESELARARAEIDWLRKEIARFQSVNLSPKAVARARR
jgi:GAF domain-containing protein